MSPTIVLVIPTIVLDANGRSFFAESGTRVSEYSQSTKVMARYAWPQQGIHNKVSPAADVLVGRWRLRVRVAAVAAVDSLGLSRRDLQSCCMCPPCSGRSVNLQ